MRIGTYNVLGLTGYPAEESRKQIDRPGTEDNVAHFTDMGVRFVMTSVGPWIDTGAASFKSAGGIA